MVWLHSIVHQINDGIDHVTHQRFEWRASWWCRTIPVAPFIESPTHLRDWKHPWRNFNPPPLMFKLLNPRCQTFVHSLETIPSLAEGEAVLLATAKAISLLIFSGRLSLHCKLCAVPLKLVKDFGDPCETHPPGAAVLLDPRDSRTRLPTPGARFVAPTRSRTVRSNWLCDRGHDRKRSEGSTLNRIYPGALF